MTFLMIRLNRSSPLQRAGDGEGIGIGTSILLGAGADVADLETERAVYRDAEAETPAETPEEVEPSQAGGENASAA